MDKEIWTADGSDFQVKLVNHHQVQKIAGSGIQKDGTVAISQHLKVNELQTFEVGGSLHVHQLEHSKIQLYIDFFDANNQFIGANITEQLHPTPDYVTLHNEGQIPKHAVRALVYVIIRGVDDHASGAVDVDKLMFRYK